MPLIWLSLLLVLCVPTVDGQYAPKKVQRPGIKEVQQPFASLETAATFKIGGNADWVAIERDGVWVAGAEPFNLQRINPATNKVEARVDLPGEACSGLEVGFGSIWVPACSKPPALLRVDLRTAKIVATMTAGPAGPEGGIAASNDSIWLVTDNKGTLSRIDPLTNTVRQKIRIPAGSLNPIFDDGMIWITSPKTDSLTVVEASSGAFVSEIPVGPTPHFLTAGDGSVWTLNQGDGTISRVDEKSRKLIATIPAGIPGPGGDICFGGGAVWATIFDVPLTMIDPAINKVVRQWIGPGGDSMRFGHNSLWITDYRSGLLSRIPVSALKRNKSLV